MQPNASSGPLRVALIGLSQGYYARRYSVAAAQTPGMQVVAVCDLGADDTYVAACLGTDAPSHARRLGARLVHSLDETLTLGIDLAIVTGETCDHADLAIRCLDAGADVFVGKPLSWEPAEVRRVMDAETRSGRAVFPSEPARFEPDLEQVRARIREGAVGDVRLVRVTVSHEAVTSPTWRRDPGRSGGPVGEFATYAVDILRWMTGEEPLDITARGVCVTHEDLGQPDAVQAICRFPSGLGTFSLLCFLGESYPFLDLEAAGTGGALRCEYRSPLIETPVHGRAVLGSRRDRDMNLYEWQHIVACLRHPGEPRRFTTLDALHVAEGVQATLRSLESGSAEAVRPVP